MFNPFNYFYPKSSTQTIELASNNRDYEFVDIQHKLTYKVDPVKVDEEIIAKPLQTPKNVISETVTEKNIEVEVGKETNENEPKGDNKDKIKKCLYCFSCFVGIYLIYRKIKRTI